MKTLIYFYQTAKTTTLLQLLFHKYQMWNVSYGAVLHEKSLHILILFKNSTLFALAHMEGKSTTPLYLMELNFIFFFLINADQPSARWVCVGLAVAVAAYDVLSYYFALVVE